jgi:hypothetical protein
MPTKLAIIYYSSHGTNAIESAGRVAGGAPGVRGGSLCSSPRVGQQFPRIGETVNQR